MSNASFFGLFLTAIAKLDYIQHIWTTVQPALRHS